jgi:uncharacterized membrane protein
VTGAYVKAKTIGQGVVLTATSFTRAYALEQESDVCGEMAVVLALATLLHLYFGERSWLDAGAHWRAGRIWALTLACIVSARCHHP